MMKNFGTTSGVLGLLGVGLGAFGAHALRPTLEAAGTVAAWQTAVLYHLVHAVALLAIASHPHRFSRAAGVCWTIGVLAFSGSLYVLALGGPRWLGPVTPLGGLFLLAGWAGVALGFWRRAESTPRS
jgi:uncharacterized membrane protein YgdD (TMEM256/DUF423 family)